MQDNNGTIENEELRGFLKDLLELVKKVCIHTTVVKRQYFNILHNFSKFYAVTTRRLYLVSSNYSNTLLVFYRHCSNTNPLNSDYLYLLLSLRSNLLWRIHVVLVNSPPPNQPSPLKISSQNNLLQTCRKTIMNILGFLIASSNFSRIYLYCKCLSLLLLHRISQFLIVQINYKHTVVFFFSRCLTGFMGNITKKI